MSTVYPETLRIPSAGSPIEVLLIDDRDLPEEIAGTFSYVFELKTGLDSQASTVLSKSASGASLTAGVLAFTLTGLDLAAVAPGVYWGFLRVTISAVSYDLYRPVRVEVTES